MYSCHDAQDLNSIFFGKTLVKTSVDVTIQNHPREIHFPIGRFEDVSLESFW